jgi:hypothetical protein
MYWFFKLRDKKSLIRGMLKQCILGQDLDSVLVYLLQKVTGTRS